MLKFVLLMTVVCGAAAQAINWCAMQTQYCGTKEHIACEPNSFKMGTNVTDIQVVSLTTDIKNMIVDRHNYYRRRVASGQEPGLSSASKMRQMFWNDNLAYVANAHAKHANFQHDQCRASNEFPYSGQNLAISWSSQPFINIQATLQGQVNSWYDTEMSIVRDRMQSCIDKFTSSPNCLEAGHFTVMVKDSNRACGCAAYTFRQFMQGNWWYTLMTTCNYADTNMLNSPIYARGAACSACSGSCNNGLCA
ncbi:hypothetical protein DMENIID0001_145190 [Sergentomyia squamirostris]